MLEAGFGGVGISWCWAQDPVSQRSWMYGYFLQSFLLVLGGFHSYVSELFSFVVGLLLSYRCQIPDMRMHEGTCKRSFRFIFYTGFSSFTYPNHPLYGCTSSTPTSIITNTPIPPTPNPPNTPTNPSIVPSMNSQNSIDHYTLFPPPPPSSPSVLSGISPRCALPPCTYIHTHLPSSNAPVEKNYTDLSHHFQPP